MIHINQHHKQLIFCTSQIVSVSIADTENRFSTDTRNHFLSSATIYVVAMLFASLSCRVRTLSCHTSYILLVIINK
jgi:hypothetical protein